MFRKLIKQVPRARLYALRQHRFSSSQLPKQDEEAVIDTLDQLKSEIMAGGSGKEDGELDPKAQSSIDELSQDSEKNNEEQFQEMFDKYYTNIEDAEAKLNEDQKNFMQKLDATKMDPLTYFHQYSSSYYQKSQAKFEQEVQSFDSKVQEQLSDYKNQYSDLKFSDGTMSGRGRFSTKEDPGEFKNHRFNKYEHYVSGYETTMDMPKFKVFQAFAFPIFVAMACGAFLLSQKNKPKKNDCWAEAEEPAKKLLGAQVNFNPGRNSLQSRAQILINPANQPCEDRFNVHQFANIDGFYAGVFDGHGGWQVSELAMKKLHVYIDEELKNSRKDVPRSIQKAFKRLEDEWDNIAWTAFEGGFPKAAYVGSCALVSVVVDNKLYVANAGDSKAALIRQTSDGSYERVKISKTFNANKKYEQERLKKQFPKELDIVRCRGEGACYVKGSLMPTRAFGDVRLKDSKYNFHNHPLDLGYRPPIPKANYSGGYISYEPDVQVFDLTAQDRFLILASDGLWDELDRKTSAKIVSDLESGGKYEVNSKTVAAQLMNECLQIVSKKHGVSRDFIGQIRPGPQKRQIVDDITIVCIDLKNQFQA